MSYSFLMERKKIGEILVELGVLEPELIERVLTALQRRPGRVKFGQIAKDMGLVGEEHILAALAVQLELIPHASDLTFSRLMRTLCDPNTAPPKPQRFPLARRR